MYLNVIKKAIRFEKKNWRILIGVDLSWSISGSIPPTIPAKKNESASTGVERDEYPILTDAIPLTKAATFRCVAKFAN